MTKIRAGIIGLGVGEKHIQGYQLHERCEVVALCDFSEDKLSTFGKRYPHMKITKDSNEILRDPTIDIISIASYDNYHFDQIVSAIKNGKHIFVEKPLCLSINEATQIRKLLQENLKLKLSSNLNLRTCPRFRTLKDEVRSKRIGKLFYIEGDYLWGRIEKLTYGWRKDMNFYSIVYGAGVHIIDLILWLSGARPTEVQGYGNRIATSDSSFRYNDFAVILLKFEDGMIAKVSASGGCVHPHFHKIAVYGTDKSFVHDFSGASLFETSSPALGPVQIVDEYPGRKERAQVISSFIESIVYPDAKPVVSCDDVFTTMSVCFAAEKAIQEGRPVPVEYI